ncbi:MAG: carboxylesterase family protein [bacterium]|nr:carboxylesterase/lipase family protein [Gammaproteobacteria bacterium]
MKTTRWIIPGIFLGLCVAGCSETETQTGVAATEEKAEINLVATTRHGQVKGFEEDGVLVFKGIRYGADTASNRFMPPKLPEPWSDVKDAIAYGNSTRQRQANGLGLFSSWRTDPAPATSEDCLFLNVWTPALSVDGEPDNSKRPVMVWLHGGGFSTGSGSSNAYDGVRLVKRGDVVVVSINHRLNVFGHLYLAEYGEKFTDSGNTGILDIIQSLEWVRDNIAEFGGDPDNVMIFGESGGGMKVSVLLAMEAAKGLFHRAVIQSGPQLDNLQSIVAAASAKTVVDQLGLSEDNIDQILSIPAQDIEQATRDAMADAGPFRLGPVFDQKNFTRQPFNPGAPSQSRDIPLLIGTTRTEMTLLAGARRPELFDLTWETLPAALEQGLPGMDATTVTAGYRKLNPEMQAPELYFTAITDNGFLRRSLTLADRKADQGGAPVYFYLFNWDSPVDDGKWKAMHALEIGFVFDNVAKSESMAGLGDDQQLIADMMSESWLAFARSGNPNSDAIPQWSPYTSAERSTMVIDLNPRMETDPRQKFMALLTAE